MTSSPASCSSPASASSNRNHSCGGGNLARVSSLAGLFYSEHLSLLHVRNNTYKCFTDVQKVFAP